MEIRQLKTNDLFKMSKILKKMGLKLDTKGKSQEQLGAELVMSAIENIHLAQDEVNEFLGDLVGMTGPEFGELPIDNSFEIIQKFKSIPGIANFFKKAGQLMK
ncbi:hypothetical protein [Pseudobacteroides cellulosolvens]|uniref:Uncharacterized protein n=1 Tax=Pseudobacteroides cellulosolvens ATCC 35603 = DSM 2933 TaxID=398512 RepID=A0A0L6JH99_9FIRM|nr:hypothetical protein [Pseudobacteroides cellulosolvens]KNY24847.1 hypothetical protein Bccel_0104 [Pseudobacteroides cellulosolvens ATCC 35603 = DSM 2933]